MKVAGQSNVKAVAGSIAHNVRHGNFPTLTVMGPASVNQAVKSLAIARSYLEEEQLDFVCSPEFVHLALEGSEDRSAIKIQLTKNDAQGSAGLDGTELKVAGRSQATTLAGAIAKRVRDEKAVSLVAIGPQSVNQALKGIAIARKYLEEDHKDVDFFPSFVHVELDGTTRSGVKFVVRAFAV